LLRRRRHDLHCGGVPALFSPRETSQRKLNALDSAAYRNVRSKSRADA
jgi:hypothetical protein